MANGKEFLQSKDVAHILDCSPDDVIELVHRKKLKAEKEGRFWRYRQRDVLAYVREQREERST